MDIRGALLSAALGGGAWIVFAFVGTPIRKFWDLRGEVAHALNRYARAVAGAPKEEVLFSEVVNPMVSRAPAAQEFHRLGVAILSFWQNEAFARGFLRLAGLDGAVAAKMLLLMAEAAMSTATIGPRREEITKPLRLDI
jgi:hypothetical protein